MAFSDDDINKIKKAYPTFARKHWIISPDYDFVYDYLKEIDKSTKLSENQKKFMDVKLIACRNKLCSLQYHLFNLRKFEQKYKRSFKGILNSLGAKNMTFASITPEVMFEFEAYLFQFKALLDIFSAAVGKVYGQNPSNIKKLTKILEQKSKLKSAKKLKSLINKNNWLKEFESGDEFNKSKRDIVAHFSNISLSTMNVIKIDPMRFKTIKSKVEGRDVNKYMKNMNKKITVFLKESMKIILEEI